MGGGVLKTRQWLALALLTLLSNMNLPVDISHIKLPKVPCVPTDVDPQHEHRAYTLYETIQRFGVNNDLANSVDSFDSLTSFPWVKLQDPQFNEEKSNDSRNCWEIDHMHTVREACVAHPHYGAQLADVCCSIAEFCEVGVDFAPDWDSAVLWYHRAAILGCPEAAIRLSCAYIKGDLGLALDPRLGIYWFKHAIDLDYV